MSAPITYSSVGTVISYTDNVTNTGTTTLKVPYAVSDNKTTVNCPQTPTTLAPGASIVCTATYNITQTDLTMAR